MTNTLIVSLEKMLEDDLQSYMHKALRTPQLQAHPHPREYRVYAYPVREKCSYCKCKSREDKYHSGTCENCGAPKS